MSASTTTMRLGAPRTGVGRREIVVGAVAVTAVNAMIWAAGKAADVSFLATPPGQPTSEVSIVLIVLATFFMFVLGTVLFGVAARRSERRGRGILALGIAVAVLSPAGPLLVAEDLASGVLLSLMHLMTGAAFAIVVLRALAGAARTGR